MPDERIEFKMEKNHEVSIIDFVICLFFLLFRSFNGIFLLLDCFELKNSFFSLSSLAPELGSSSEPDSNGTGPVTLEFQNTGRNLIPWHTHRFFF